SKIPKFSHGPGRSACRCTASSKRMHRYSNISAWNFPRTFSTENSARYRSNKELQMNQRFALVLIAVCLMPWPAAGQVKLGTNALNVAPAAAKPWAVTKTQDGQPDLQGYWTNNTMAPLQRPKGVTKEFYTKEEFLEALKKQAELDGEEATPGTVEDVHYDH